MGYEGFDCTLNKRVSHESGSLPTSLSPVTACAADCFAYYLLPLGDFYPCPGNESFMGWKESLIPIRVHIPRKALAPNMVTISPSFFFHACRTTDRTGPRAA